MPLPKIKVPERISNLSNLENWHGNKPLSEHARLFLARLPIALSICFAVFLLIQWGLFFEGTIPTGSPPHGPPFILPSNISNLLGPYSPFYPVEYYVSPPSVCNITQLQRHGARFPTKGAESRIKTALSHLEKPRWNEGPGKFAFLRNYKYDLQTDNLMWFGATEAHAAGVAAYNRYAHLAHIAPPFLRAGDSLRVVDSGYRWRQGFQLAGRMKLGKILIISEAPTSNNTLVDHHCPAHTDDLADAMQAKWLSIFAPNITSFLNSQAHGSTLDNEDIPALMSLCSYESLYHYSTSPWCNVFEMNHWKNYEYYTDLEKFYGTGPGNPYGRPQGIGWINELIARMTNSSVNDTTQTNHTLDDNPKTFPLNMTMYADFTHDNEMNAIFAAMGILRMAGVPQGSQDMMESRLQTPLQFNTARAGASIVKEMDPLNPDPNRKWVASKVVPFSSQLVVEKLSCGVETTPDDDLSTDSLNDTIDPIDIPNNGNKTKANEYVRMLLNDAVIHVPGCSESIGNGICSMEEFLESQAYARSGGGGEWEKCQQVGGDDDGQHEAEKTGIVPVWI